MMIAEVIYYDIETPKGTHRRFIAQDPIHHEPIGKPADTLDELDDSLFPLGWGINRAAHNDDGTLRCG
jgi:hypothetical protein